MRRIVLNELMICLAESMLWVVLNELMIELAEIKMGVDMVSSYIPSS